MHNNYAIKHTVSDLPSQVAISLITVLYRYTVEDCFL